MITSLIEILDRVTDVILGGRETDRADPHARVSKPPFATITTDGLFVDVVRLPATTLREARDAVALQLDRLSPFDDSVAEWDLIALDAAPAVGGRNRFLLAVAPRTLLAAARTTESRGSAIEGFIADVEADGERHRALFYDQAAIARRRSRRIWLAISAVGLLAAFSFLSHEVNAALSRHATVASTQQQAISEQLAHARQREAAARELSAAVQRARDQDTLAGIAESIADLSDPPLAGLSIEKMVMSQDAIQLVGFTKDPKAVERSLRARAGLRVQSFSEAAGADPLGRGVRIEAALAPALLTDPS